MNYDKKQKDLNLQEKQTFISHTKKPVVFGSNNYNELLNFKALLSLYGYSRHEKFFDVVKKDGICFNIINNEKGFYINKHKGV